MLTNMLILAETGQCWDSKQSSRGSTPALFNSSNSKLKTEANVLQYNTLQLSLSTV